MFKSQGGFDLVLGNPPWIKVEWEEGGVLGDTEPRFVLRSFSATQLRSLREDTFYEHPNLEARWRGEFAASDGLQSFLSSSSNYPELRGIQANLYKCFLPQAWNATNETGASAFLHPEGVFDDPRGGRLRALLFARLRRHFQFINERKLFEDVQNQRLFGICVYSEAASNIEFDSISNLFHPVTVEHSYTSVGFSPVPGIKRIEIDHGVVSTSWDLLGHRRRILRITEKELSLFALLYDEAGTPPEQARLPALHAQELISVLERFAACPRRLDDLKEEYVSTVMFDETYAQRDGIIRRETKFPESVEEWVLQGPHFFVGTPLYKTPRRVCANHRAYDVVDLTYVPDQYLPRTNYVPACERDEYLSRVPRVSWSGEGEAGQRRVTEFYRLCVSRAISASGERTLQPAIIPPGVAHIDGVFSICFKDLNELLPTVGLWSSLPVDFFVRS